MKIPKTVYIKERESEKIRDLTKKINKQRESENKRPLEPVEIIHFIIKKGLIICEQE